MQVYLVGGAVRDTLLGLPIKDKDFVVVGAEPKELLAQGFVQVGADFPVFLHPDTHHEYALARLERKTGVGHTAFSVQSDKTVTLKDDLKRRDLTINALAMPVAGLFDDTITGEVVDYYGGVQDLQDKTLRHVSQAFSEDPLRVLRVARFYARFYHLGFGIDDKTKRLMWQLAQAGELSSLSCERLWSESSRAMTQACGFAYWQLLDDLGILVHMLPRLANKWQNQAIKQTTLSLLKDANKEMMTQFAALVGVGQDFLVIDECAKRLCVPKRCVHFAYLFADFCCVFAHSLSATQVLLVIERTKAYHDPQLLWQLLSLCYDYGDVSGHAMPNKALMIRCLEYSLTAYQSVGIKDIKPGLTGAHIGVAIKEQRLQKIDTLLQKHLKNQPI